MKKPEQREGHPIQVVARRTGLTLDVLRAWEKRYAAVSPSRTPTGRRIYSDADVERLLLLRRATLLGRSIGQIAQLEDEALRDLVEADETAVHPETAPGPSPARPASASGPVEEVFVRDCLAATHALDAQSLEAGLHRASFALSRPVLLERVLVPLMREIGELWSNGTLRIAHEHMATAVVRSFLGAVRDANVTASSAPSIVVATPAGQFHELGAAMVGATAVSAGWRVIYLGANLPAEELASATAQAKGRVLALSIVYPPDDPMLLGELAKLRELTPPEVEIVAGGRASEAYSEALAASGIRHIDGMNSMREYLDGLR